MTALFRCLTVLTALLGIHAMIAQAGDIKTGFVNKVFKGTEGNAKYVVFVPPDYNGQRDYPVILFLHGSGEVGADGKKQAGPGLGKAIRDKKGGFPFITVFPQSQSGGWGASTPEGKRAMAILDEVMSEFKTDPKRVYLTGLSMGGSGTFSLAAAHPERWAAIAPICGTPNPNNADKIKSLPCWAFWGDKDTAKVVDSNRTMVQALKDAGDEVRSNEYKGVGHNAWDRAYATAGLYTWLLRHASK